MIGVAVAAETPYRAPPHRPPGLICGRSANPPGPGPIARFPLPGGWQGRAERQGADSVRQGPHGIEIPSLR